MLGRCSITEVHRLLQFQNYVSPCVSVQIVSHFSLNLSSPRSAEWQAALFWTLVCTAYPQIYLHWPVLSLLSQECCQGVNNLLVFQVESILANILVHVLLCLCSPVTCVAIFSALYCLPHWPGFYLDGVEEPQMSLFDTCCCPSTEFGVNCFLFFFFYLPLHCFLAREICLFLLFLLVFFLPFFFLFSFSKWMTLLFFKNIWPGICGPCLCYARIAGTSLGSTHLFCLRHSVCESKSLSSEALGFWDISPDHLVLR